MWSSTEPATSQELARLGRDRAVKAEAPEEGEAPEAEEAPRREGEASDATSLQLVKLEEGPRKGFAGGSEVSLHGSMIGLMGEMLQQMKEQNRQQADYMKNQAEFHARSLAQQQQNERMYELCKAALSQASVHSTPFLGPGPTRTPHTGSFRDGEG